MADLLGLPFLDRTISPSEVARHLYAEGDRHPAGSAERRAAYLEAAKAQQEADRLEANRRARQRRNRIRPAMVAETKNPAGQGRGFSGETA